MSGNLTTQLDVEGEGFSNSLTSVFDVLAASGAAFDTFLNYFPGVFVKDWAGSLDLSDQGLDLFLLDALQTTASIAGKSIICRFVPTDRFTELVTALLASDVQINVAGSHDWPILSVVSDHPSVAEAPQPEKRTPSGGDS